MHAKCRKSHFFAKMQHQQDGQTDGPDTIHTSFSSTQTVSREHNSPSGNKGGDDYFLRGGGILIDNTPDQWNTTGLTPPSG